MEGWRGRGWRESRVITRSKYISAMLVACLTGSLVITHATKKKVITEVAVQKATR